MIIYISFSIEVVVAYTRNLISSHIKSGHFPFSLKREKAESKFTLDFRPSFAALYAAEKKTQKNLIRLVLSRSQASLKKFVK